jgi:hypothetical protein
MELPYRILQKGDKFYPQIFKNNFGSERSGPKSFPNEETARKFMAKQARYRLKLSWEHRQKYATDRTEYDKYEQEWLNNIDKAPLVVEEPEPVVVKERVIHTASVMKYIVIRSEDQRGHLHELPIMFPYVLIHKEMKECTWRALMESDHRFIECIGAGFCTIQNNRIKCYGESESLGIKSRGKIDEQAFDRCERSETSTLVNRK